MSYSTRTGTSREACADRCHGRPRCRRSVRIQIRTTRPRIDVAQCRVHVQSDTVRINRAIAGGRQRVRLYKQLSVSLAPCYRIPSQRRDERGQALRLDTTETATPHRRGLPADGEQRGARQALASARHLVCGQRDVPCGAPSPTGRRRGGGAGVKDDHASSRGPCGRDGNRGVRSGEHAGACGVAASSEVVGVVVELDDLDPHAGTEETYEGIYDTRNGDIDREVHEHCSRQTDSNTSSRAMSWDSWLHILEPVLDGLTLPPVYSETWNTTLVILLSCVWPSYCSGQNGYPRAEFVNASDVR